MDYVTRGLLVEGNNYYVKDKKSFRAYGNIKDEEKIRKSVLSLHLICHMGILENIGAQEAGGQYIENMVRFL